MHDKHRADNSWLDPVGSPCAMLCANIKRLTACVTCKNPTSPAISNTTSEARHTYPGICGPVVGTAIHPKPSKKATAVLAVLTLWQTKTTLARHSCWKPQPTTTGATRWHPRGMAACRNRLLLLLHGLWGKQSTTGVEHLSHSPGHIERCEPCHHKF